MNIQTIISHRFFRIALRILAALLVTLLAWNLRSNAVKLLPPDYDEDDYLRAAQEYAAVFRSGDLSGLTQYNYRPEHPPLAKIIFGAALLSTPEEPLIPDRSTTAGPDSYISRNLLTPARTINAIFGMLTVFLLGLINPFAGLMLAIHALTVKYTSQVMLEALPALTSILAVMAYSHAVTRNAISRHKTALIAISAIFLGLTAASKYLYAVAGIAILIDWLLTNWKTSQPASRTTAKPAHWLIPILLWGLLAITIFFVADPYLWPDPIGRLKDSIFYHASYSTTAAEVQNANFPFYQPFVWLFLFSVSVWSPMAFSIAVDSLVALIACFGLAQLWKKHRVYALWLIIGLGFLLVWPTKWPQYIVTIIVPVTLAAGEAISSFLASLLDTWKNLGNEEKSSKKDTRRALPWIIPGLLIFGIFTLFPLFYQFAMSTTDFSLLSLFDGMRGGVMREFWGGITGQISPTFIGNAFQSKEVSYIGTVSYLPILERIANSGMLGFNILWTVTSVGLQTALGLAAALLLWHPRTALRKSWQTLFILPWAIPETIGAVMWFTIFAPESGWLALATQKFGPDIPFSFLLDWGSSLGKTFFVLLIISLWYGFPFMMLAASAGLKLVPAEVFDAAQMDGANAWQTFRHVTWPLLRPLLLPAIIVRGIFAFNQFYLFQVSFMFGNRTLATLSTFSYNIFNPNSGWSRDIPPGQFATAAGLNIITMLILFVFVVIFNHQSNASKGVDYA
jgi:ABC-type sugar transport system permease subunit